MAVPALKPEPAKTASRADPALRRAAPARRPASYGGVWENRPRYDRAASSGSVVDGDPLNETDPEGLVKVILYPRNTGNPAQDAENAALRAAANSEPDLSGVCQVYAHMNENGVEVGPGDVARDPAGIARVLNSMGCKNTHIVLFLGCRAAAGADPIAERYSKEEHVPTVGSTRSTWWQNGHYWGTWGHTNNDVNNPNPNRYFSFVTYVIQQLLNYTCPSKSVSQICTTNENTLTAECAPYCASNISYFYAHHVTEIIAILFAVLMCIYGALYAISLRHVRRYRTMTGSQ